MRVFNVNGTVHKIESNNFYSIQIFFLNKKKKQKQKQKKRRYNRHFVQETE